MTSVARSWPGASRVGTMRRNPAAAWRHVDFVLFGATLALAAIGTLMVYSITKGSDPAAPNYHELGQHLVFAAAGITTMAVTSIFDYRRYRDFAPALYLGVVTLLAGVLSPLGTGINGTQAWYDLGTFHLQPSEFTKVVLVLVLASLGANYGGDVDVKRLTILLGAVGFPLGLILLQPDVGTGMVLTAITMGVLLVAGVSWKYISALTLIGVCGIVFIFSSGLLEKYQQDRLTVFVNPELSSSDDAYNLNESKRAIGSGGLTGQGIFEGPQTQGDYVPEQETDFIFSAVGEEMGFVGTSVVLLLFMVMVWRIWRIAQISRDQLGALICVGVLSMFVFHIFQNTGMTMGIMPITGIPLPLLSHGGSSTLAAFAALGLVHNVHMRRFS